MTDLTYASTQELLDELKSRHLTMVYLGERLVDSESAFYDGFKGSAVSILGLLAVATDRMILENRDANPGFGGDHNETK